MIKLGADISVEEAGLVFDHFDKEKDGKLSYEEYVKMMMSGGEISEEEEHKKNEIEKLKRKEEKQMKDKELLDRTNLEAVVWRVDERKRRQITPQSLFDMFDHDNNGCLSKDELIDAFDRWSFKCTEDEIDAVYVTYADEDGLMDYRDFIRFIMGGNSESGKRVNQSNGPDVYEANSSEDEHDYAAEDASNDHEGNADHNLVTTKAKARRAFTRRRSIGFADPNKSYLNVTIYGAVDLLKGKDKMPLPQPYENEKKWKKIPDKPLKDATCTPEFGDHFEIGKGKGSDQGLVGLKEILITVKTSRIAVFFIVNNSFQHPKLQQIYGGSNEIPLSCHEKQTPAEHGYYGLLDIGLRVFEQNSEEQNVER